MAIGTPTSLTTLGNSTSASSNVTASVSPTANALLVVYATTQGTTLATLSITDTFAGTGTWSNVTTNAGTKNSYMFTAKAGSSPGSGTVTINSSAAQNRWMIIVMQITGQDPTTPIGATGVNTSVVATLSITLTGTPLVSSCVIGGMGSYTVTTYTKGANYTDIVHVAATTNAVADTEYNIGGQFTTVDWSALGTSQNVGCAIEILAERIPPLGPEVGMNIMMQSQVY